MSNDATRLWVISAPSGAGKTTLIDRLMKDRKEVAFSVSHTTRPPRAGEQDGVHYHFVDDAVFSEMIEKEEFLEWAQVHAARYGTSKAAAQEVLDSGRQAILDIDVQGGIQVLEKMPEAHLIFILPPSWEVLKARLMGRGRGEDEAELRLRLDNARGEIEAARGVYARVLVNDDLEEAAKCLESMVLRGEGWPGSEGPERAKKELDRFLNSGTMVD